MTIYEFTIKETTGKETALNHYKDHVLLIVNTATKCGFSPQFRGLEQLYQTYKGQNFAVLGFPCNQFMSQEPVSNEQMASVCERNFGVTFPLFAKIDVNGKKTEPLYSFLKKEQKGVLSSAIKWNFTKFLIDRKGYVVKRYGPNVAPETIEIDIKKLLQDQ